MNNPEVSLRELWTRKGVPKARQDAIIAEIVAKAQPGAWVGPFRIGEPTSETKARHDALFPESAMPFNLIQDAVPDSAGIQAEHDRRREHEARMQDAQQEMSFA